MWNEILAYYVHWIKTKQNKRLRVRYTRMHVCTCIHTEKNLSILKNIHSLSVPRQKMPIHFIYSKRFTGVYPPFFFFKKKAIFSCIQGTVYKEARIIPKNGITSGMGYTLGCFSIVSLACSRPSSWYWNPDMFMGLFSWHSHSGWHQLS